MCSPRHHRSTAAAVRAARPPGRHGQPSTGTPSRRLLDPPRPRTTPPGTWQGGELPPGVQRALAADATDRSAALHRLVGACVRAGMNEDTIHQLAGSYQPALEKYGARLDAEVERSLRRIGAA